MNATRDLRTTLVGHLEGVVRNAEDDLANWRARFDKDPNHAFKWGLTAVAAAARRVVALDVLAWFKRGTDLDRIHKEIKREAIDGARFPEHSTSPISNLAHQMRVQAWAELLVKFEEEV